MVATTIAIRCWIEALLIFIVVIGGLGTIEGPIIGVIVFYALQRYLADLAPGI